MKTRYLIAAASALLLAAGCAREMDFNTPGSNVLKAVIESGETRVSFDEMGKFTWDEGDKIAVYVGDAFEQVTVDYQTGEFKLVSTADRSFYAVYPATAAPADNSALTVTLPATYDISSVTDADYSPVPMVAQNIQGQDELYFLHVGGLVRIFGKVDAPASTAVVTFDKDVTGTYTVNTSNPANPTITTAGTASNNTVTFTLPNTTSFVLNVPVPCGTYDNISVAIDGGTPVKLNTVALTFARHHGKTLEIGEVSFEYRFDGLNREVIAQYVGGTKELAQAFSSYKTPDLGTTKVGVPFEFEFCEDPYVMDPNTGDPVFEWTTTPPAWLSVADGVDYTGSTTGEPLHLVLTSQVNTAVDYHALELASRSADPDVVDLSTINVATGATVEKSTANTYVVTKPGSYKFPVVYGNGIKDGLPNETAWHGTKGVGGEYRTEDEVHVVGNDIDSDIPFQAPWGHLAYFKDHRDRDIKTPYILKHLEDCGDQISELKVEIPWMDAISNEGSGTLDGRLLVQNAHLDGDGENAYIAFDVPAEGIQQGNVMIALKATYTTATGETYTDVIWNWLIWVTDNDLTAVDGPDGVKFSPLNLGWRDTRETSRYDERVWYVRLKQTETGGTTSDPVKVTSLAGKIVIEYGGRSLLYPDGRNAPRLGTFFQKTGTNEPVAKSAPYYRGYQISATEYTDDITKVPELQEDWVYEDYATPRPGETYGTQHGWRNWDDPKTPGVENNISLMEPLTIGLGIRYPRVNFSTTRVLTWCNIAWHNLWDSSEHTLTGAGAYTAVNTNSEAPTTKTIYDPCPVGYKVPSYDHFKGFNTANTPRVVVDGVAGRMYGGNLFIPFVPVTNQNIEMARYATTRFNSANSRIQFDIYSDYVYGSTGEAWTATYVIRPVME